MELSHYALRKYYKVTTMDDEEYLPQPSFGWSRALNCEVPFDEARALVNRKPRSDAYRQLARLEHKIPMDLRGFFLISLKGTEDEPLMDGILVQPNAPILAMNALMQPLGLHRQGHHHGDNSTPRFEKETFRMAMHDDEPRILAGAEPSLHFGYERTGIDTVKQKLAEQGYDYVRTDTLSKLLVHGHWPRAERALLERLATQIPANLQGVFVVDVARNAEGKFCVGAVSVDPNIANHIVTQGFAAPLLSEEAKQLDIRTQSMSVGLPPHTRTLTLYRSDLERLNQKIEDTYSAQGAGAIAMGPRATLSPQR